MASILDTVASFGRRVRILRDLIEEQVEQLANKNGLSLKAAMLSPVMLLGEKKEMTAAEIARSLDDSHQLTTKRINWLVENRFAEARMDKDDSRRKLIRLTSKGKKEVVKIRKLSRQLSSAYLNLFEELDVDLNHLCEQAASRLRSSDLSARSKEST